MRNTHMTKTNVIHLKDTVESELKNALIDLICNTARSAIQESVKADNVTIIDGTSEHEVDKIKQDKNYAV